MTDKPGPWLRWFLRLPILLYRWHLGWLLGSRFMLLRHHGRRTGRQHQTVVEVMGKAPGEPDLWYVAAGWGLQTDWLLNAQQEGQVLVQVGSRLTTTSVSVVEPESAAAIIRAYAGRHALAFQLVYRFLADRPFDTMEAAIAHACQALSVIAFRAIV